jgi:hypothetical protein
MKLRNTSFAEAAKLIEATGLIEGSGSRQASSGSAGRPKIGIRVAAPGRKAEPSVVDPSAPLRPWLNAKPIVEGSVADIYLKQRGIVLTAAEAKSLRSHPALFHWPSRQLFPALVALVVSIGDGEPCAHQTFLSPDGLAKAPVDKPRLFPKGAHTGGAGVWFGDASSGEFIIAEGLETALASMRLFNAVAGCAALSAHGIRRLLLPPPIRRLRIMADYDGPGLTAAHEAARRWRGEGREVVVSRPSEQGRDANDVWLARLRERGDG